jgi:glycosyltransferase involved in cell wall biosynthesis
MKFQKKKFLIIRSIKESKWGSCKVITPNIIKAYETLQGPEFFIKYFDIADDVQKADAFEGTNYLSDLSDVIKTWNPTELVFADHHPPPASVLLFLKNFMPLSELPPIIFHIYGDFTFYAGPWSFLGKKLLKHPVKFIVASESQNKLLDFFIKDPSSIEQYLFPYSSETYYFDELERNAMRAKENISDVEKILLYSGRISLQKNVDMLLREFADLSETDSLLRLWIVGSFDDVGAGFMGVKTNDGYLFSKYEQILNSFPEKTIKKIKFWGYQTKNDLRMIKNASDYFISLSLYHDEDYGMSPAEAMACGLPALLTDWGGYSSFQSKKRSCSLIPVQINEFGIGMEMNSIRSFLNDKNNLKNSLRRKIDSIDFSNEFSIVGSSGKLLEIVNKPFVEFEGFKLELDQFSYEYWTPRAGEISLELTPSSENYYATVYRNYISNNHQK